MMTPFRNRSFSTPKVITMQYRENSWDRFKETSISKLATLCHVWNRWCWFVTLPNAVAAVFIFMLLIGMRFPVDDPTAAGKMSVISVEKARAEEGALREFREFQSQVMAVREEFGVHQRALRSVQTELGNLDTTVRQFSDQIDRIQTEISDVQITMEKWSETTKSSQKACNVSSKVESLDGAVKQIADQLNGLQSQFKEVDKELKAVAEMTPVALPGQELLSTENLASRRSGAHVVPEQSSPQMIRGSFFNKLYANLWSVSSYQWPVTDRSIIDSGDAFCFNGSSGVITVALSTPSTVTSVLYEHDYWNTIMPISAPKEYRVKICADRSCSESEEVGVCDYLEGRRKVGQMCKLQSSSTVAAHVQLEILSNYGQNYTCLYSVKVY